MSRVLTEFEVHANAVQSAVQRLRNAVDDVDDCKAELQKAEEERREATAALAQARDAMFKEFPELAPEPGDFVGAVSPGSPAAESDADWTPPSSGAVAVDASDTVPWVAPGGGLEFRKMD